MLWGAGLLLALSVVFREPVMATLRRRRVMRMPFPFEWRSVLRRHWPYFRRLPADLQLQLKKRMQLFLAEKPVVGCGGLAVTDAMRVLIAAQACLLLLNRGYDAFENVREILLYPASFVAPRSTTDTAGVRHEQRQVLAGESWARGQVILSWQDVLEGAAIADDGRNVVIHEFAHQLDQAKGSATGLPLGIPRQLQGRWAQVMGNEFALLQRQVSVGAPTLLDPYGATDPAEFFAVASEVFFEQPRQLAASHTALYQQLSGYYRIDPLSWS